MRRKCTKNIVKGKVNSYWYIHTNVKVPKQSSGKKRTLINFSKWHFWSEGACDRLHKQFTYLNLNLGTNKEKSYVISSWCDYWKTIQKEIDLSKVLCWPILEPSWLSTVFSLLPNVDTSCGFRLSFLICIGLCLRLCLCLCLCLCLSLLIAPKREHLSWLSSIFPNLHQNDWFQKVVCSRTMADKKIGSMTDKKIQMSKFRPAMNFVWVKYDLN